MLNSYEIHLLSESIYLSGDITEETAIFHAANVGSLLLYDVHENKNPLAVEVMRTRKATCESNKRYFDVGLNIVEEALMNGNIVKK